MAESKLSVEEMLAYCYRVDGEGGEAPPPQAEETAAEPEPQAAAAEEKEEAPAEKPKPAAAAKDPAKMSVADMLAAARSTDAEGGGGEEAEAAEEPAEEASPEPAAKAPTATKDPAKMSVADMLAAARSQDSAAAKETAKESPKPAAKAKAAPKKAAAKKEAPKKEAAPTSTGPKESASILGGAPKKHKAGPISKAELAAREKSGEAKAKKEKPKIEAPPMPPKPAYAKPEPAARRQEPDEGRRGVLAMAGAGLSVMVGTALGLGFSTMAATFGLWSLGLARFMFPNVIRQPPTSFKIGFPADFPPGMVETKFKGQYGVWIVNGEYKGEQQLYALSTVCTHLGCTPNWLEAEQKFKCPCHGSGFYKSGINFEGPAPRPLERYAIQIADDGQLQVDKSQKFQEEMGQWTNPASFVPV